MERGYEPIRSSLSAILEFLTTEFLQGKQYRTINTYRSAISMTHGPIDGVVVGKHPLVCRLLKGVYNQRPPQPRYSFTWDVCVVLDYIRSWGLTTQLTRKEITLKIAMLLALANASRSSELHALDSRHMSWSTEGITFTLTALTKNLSLAKARHCFIQNLSQTERCAQSLLLESI